jgi:hypothetical protein
MNAALSLKNPIFARKAKPHRHLTAIERGVMPVGLQLAVEA